MSSSRSSNREKEDREVELPLLSESSDDEFSDIIVEMDADDKSSDDNIIVERDAATNTNLTTTIDNLPNEMLDKIALELKTNKDIVAFRTVSKRFCKQADVLLQNDLSTLQQFLDCKRLPFSMLYRIREALANAAPESRSIREAVTTNVQINIARGSFTALCCAFINPIFHLAPSSLNPVITSVIAGDLPELLKSTTTIISAFNTAILESSDSLSAAATSSILGALINAAISFHHFDPDYKETTSMKSRIIHSIVGSISGATMGYGGMKIFSYLMSLVPTFANYTVGIHGGSALLSTSIILAVLAIIDQCQSSPYGRTSILVDFGVFNSTMFASFAGPATASLVMGIMTALDAVIGSNSPEVTHTAIATAAPFATAAVGTLNYCVKSLANWGLFKAKEKHEEVKSGNDQKIARLHQAVAALETRRIAKPGAQ